MTPLKNGHSTRGGENLSLHLVTVPRPAHLSHWWMSGSSPSRLAIPGDDDIGRYSRAPRCNWFSPRCCGVHPTHGSNMITQKKVFRKPPCIETCRRICVGKAGPLKNSQADELIKHCSHCQLYVLPGRARCCNLGDTVMTSVRTRTFLCNALGGSCDPSPMIRLFMQCSMPSQQPPTPVTSLTI